MLEPGIPATGLPLVQWQPLYSVGGRCQPSIAWRGPGASGGWLAVGCVWLLVGMRGARVARMLCEAFALLVLVLAWGWPFRGPGGCPGSSVRPGRHTFLPMMSVQVDCPGIPGALPGSYPGVGLPIATRAHLSLIAMVTLLPW